MSRGTHEYRAGSPVHRPRAPGAARRAGFEARLHPGMHPGGEGGGRRGADARPPGVRRDLQLRPLLHRQAGRGPDLDRRLLSRRNHRGNIIRLCREHAIPVRECNFSLTDVYGAEESFVTGTFAGVAGGRRPVPSAKARADLLDGARAVAVPGSRGARVRGVSAGTSTAPAPAPIQPRGSASLRRVRRSPRTAPACRPTSVCPPFRRT